MSATNYPKLFNFESVKKAIVISVSLAIYIVYSRFSSAVHP